MKRKRPRTRNYIIMLAVLFPISLLLLTGCGGATEVRFVTPRKGDITESFLEPARTRLAKTYLITMPVSGRINRIELEPGYKVSTGQTLAKYDLVPFQQALAEARAAVDEFDASLKVAGDVTMENTTLIQSSAAVKSAEEALKSSQAQINALKKREMRAAKELERLEKLDKEGAVSKTTLDDARLNSETSTIDLRKAEFSHAGLDANVTAVKLEPKSIKELIARKGLEREVVVHRLAQAKARLARAEHELKLAEIKSPIDGVVLERYSQGDGTLAAGTPLLLLGNLEQLEVIAEVLTQDALKLKPGTEVSLEPATGSEKVSGNVSLIEPSGFTKLSSLGVEQQRVNVIVVLDNKPKNLGVGYQVQARFLTGSKKEAMVIPRFSVLQAPDRSFYVFKIVDDKLVRQGVEIGLQCDLELEVTKGLFITDKIVAAPDTTMDEKMKVKVTGRTETP
ncbi:MAG: HlyD family efflux transporter periplasmic adaptor subunit [Planctomycetota bacterium]|nr:MAG: HlyD family efflux transporter periplasmic adaptor subunit [Planctomycetota bacterium]